MRRINIIIEYFHAISAKFLVFLTEYQSSIRRAKLFACCVCILLYPQVESAESFYVEIAVPSRYCTDPKLLDSALIRELYEDFAHRPPNYDLIWSKCDAQESELIYKILRQVKKHRRISWITEEEYQEENSRPYPSIMVSTSRFLRDIWVQSIGEDMTWCIG